jgi:hypothetical protein
VDAFFRKLLDQQARLKAEIARLEGELRGIDFALKSYSSTFSATESVPNDGTLRSQSSAVGRRSTRLSTEVLRILNEAGEPGVTSREVIDRLQDRSVPVSNPNTVTSLLSVWKSRGRVKVQDGRYSLLSADSPTTLAFGESERR